MKTKVIVLLSIVLLIFSVPAFALEGDATLSLGVDNYQYQEGNLIQDGEGNTTGGYMLQHGSQATELNANSKADIPCADCDEEEGSVGAIGGFAYSNSGGESSIFEGQSQIGMAGSGNIDIGHYLQVTSEKDGSFTFNKTENESKTIDMDKTDNKTVDMDKTKTFDLSADESKTVNVDKSGSETVDVDKGETVNVVKNEDETNTTASGSIEGDSTYETDKVSLEGEGSGEWNQNEVDENKTVDVDKTETVDVAKNETEAVDVAVDETKLVDMDKTETFDLNKSETETFDLSVEKHEDLALSGSYAENCSTRVEHGTTFGWEGNGVMGTQVQGSYQSGYVNSGAAGGTFQYTPVNGD